MSKSRGQTMRQDAMVIAERHIAASAGTTAVALGDQFANIAARASWRRQLRSSLNGSKGVPESAEFLLKLAPDEGGQQQCQRRPFHLICVRVVFAVAGGDVLKASVRAIRGGTASWNTLFPVHLPSGARTSNEFIHASGCRKRTECHRVGARSLNRGGNL